eukprot:gnl/MRDRNA2_/MRDRNA2_34921_c0_seq1.p1 gnl/MRDRNA2_/MRDRNA2_34921_c0~~gnl/MRDRNA2_/MRDRNA2_34921_c0_seq1.p1  ORF type:complete len:218 (-),score=43.46 gnl/MRDRNA2_/MRDRNA2_34921_c0_seq1:141-794(-)
MDHFIYDSKKSKEIIQKGLADNSGAQPPVKLPTWCVEPGDAERSAMEIVHRIKDRVGREIGSTVRQVNNKAWHVLGRKAAHALAFGPHGMELVGEKTSRQHAMMLRNWYGEVFLMDLGSVHGTFLDNKKLEKAKPEPWHPGSVAHFSEKATDWLELKQAERSGRKIIKADRNDMTSEDLMQRHLQEKKEQDEKSHLSARHKREQEKREHMLKRQKTS